jgi:probable HAF family extracellular repeat protein
MEKSALRVVAVVIASALSPVYVFAGTSYSLQQLGPLGSAGQVQAGSLSTGEAAGFVINSYGYQVPVVFSGGSANPLPGVGQANAISSSGLVVGTTYQGNTPFVSTWSGGQLTPVSVSGYGTAANDLGQIAGGYLAGNALHAFISSSGGITDLGTLGGNWSSAYGLNDWGQAAGTSSINSVGTMHAFYFSNTTGMIDLGTLGGTSSNAVGINLSGEVVGSSQTTSGFSNAFVWNSGTFSDLGTLGGNQSYGEAINDSGMVVGYSWTAGNTITHGFVYSNGVMVDLNSILSLGSEWTVTGAYGINDAGQILATADYAGEDYAVELNPVAQSAQARLLSVQPLSVPEPSAFQLVGFGALLVFANRMRRRNVMAR